MKIRWFSFLLFITLSAPMLAQKNNAPTTTNIDQLTIPLFIQEGKCFYKGDSIPYIVLPTVYIFPPLVFKSDAERQSYNRLVYNVKRVLPIAIQVRILLMETYEYLQTLPNKRAKDQHIKAVEKGIKQQYTPMMKQLTYSQGKLLIKLIDRECNQSSYDILKAFMGPLRASFYQVFASTYGASLRKEYDPYVNDRLIERVVLLAESGGL